MCGCLTPPPGPCCCAGFEERHNLYKLFHLLNHAGMYGHEYVLMAEEVAEKVLDA